MAVTRKFHFNLHQFHDAYPDLAKYNMDLYGVSTPENPQDNTLLYCMTEEVYERIPSVKNSLIIAPEAGLSKALSNVHLDNHNTVIFFRHNPRLEYAKMLRFILENATGHHYRDYWTGVSFSQNFGVDTKIGSESTVGRGTIIEPGAIIGPYVTIGKNCYIKANAVIGGQGFAVERDNRDGRTYRIPHLGGVVIGDNVEIGSFTTVVSGTIEPTILEDEVMVDDHVHIAHNSHIGHGTLVIACAEVSGSVRIGERCWIAPNATIRNGLTIGDDVTVGMGAVVTKNIESGKTVVGNPARGMQKK